MTGGDPVEESGQALRTGFVQAMQTAHTTQALMGRWGGESRSRAEHEQRLSTSAAKEGRSLVEHRLRVDQQLESRWWDRQLSSARVEEVRARISQAKKLHKVEKRKLEGQIDRSDRDLERRDQAGELDREHKQTLHSHQITGYENREQRAGELHALEVEYKQLLIDIRRRAAGFTETLTDQTGPQSAAAATSSAAFAADAAAGGPEEPAEDSAAFHQRFAEDTGMDPRKVFRDAHFPGAAEPAPSPMWLRDIDGLVRELGALAYLLPLMPDAPEPHTEVGEWIEASVEDAGLHEPIDVDVVNEEADLPSSNLPMLWVDPELEP
ncbi:hypothetical protein [Nocardia rhamnosiphila]